MGTLGLILVVRVCALFEPVLRSSLLPGLLAFWRTDRFGGLLLVTDNGPQEDEFAARLVGDAPHLVLPVKSRPVPPELEGLLGYDMQQYDTLVLDTYLPPGASPDTLLGIVDADSLLVTFPTMDAFFDGKGRPRALLRVEVPFGKLWVGAAAASEWFIGKLQPARGMCTFPVLVRAKHLAAMRAHVEALHGVSFVSAFAQLVARGLYSQFNLLMTYLWHFHQKEYAWSYWVVQDGLLASSAVREWTQVEGVNGAPPTWVGSRYNFSSWLPELQRTPGHMVDFPFVTAENGKTRARSFIHYRHERSPLPLQKHLQYDLCYSLLAANGSRVERVANVWRTLCSDGAWMAWAVEYTRQGEEFSTGLGLSLSLFEFEFTNWITNQLDGSPVAAQTSLSRDVVAGLIDGTLDLSNAVDVLHWYSSMPPVMVAEPLSPTPEATPSAVPSASADGSASAER